MLYIYREIGKMCPHGYHHNNGIVKTRALGQMMYG